MKKLGFFAYLGSADPAVLYHIPTITEGSHVHSPPMIAKGIQNKAMHTPKGHT